MPCRHHPGEEFLESYASGRLEEPLALMVATHTALCPCCRAKVRELETVAGALLETLEPGDGDACDIDAVLSRLNENPQEEPGCSAVETQHEIGDLRLPQPLRGYLGQPIEKLPWRQRGDVAEVALKTGGEGFHTRLLRIKAGAAIPQHTHEGAEVTLVLSGGFSDGRGHYLRGDVCLADSEVDHRPVADPDEDCICLAITDAPLRLTGPLGRWLNFFVRV